MNNVLLLVGGSGFLGQHLIERYHKERPVVIFSRDEAKQWIIQQKYPGIEVILGDIRDASRLCYVMRRYQPNTVIIVAALKQIPFCEKFPEESVRTNIEGIRNALEAAHTADTCLFVSSDKACMPINVYGMCKAISERLVISAAAAYKNTRYIVTRYGNVLDSTGSVIPLFKRQVEGGGPITVTDVTMTRFIMRVSQSADLIAEALLSGESGDIYIPIIKSMRVGQLAELFAANKCDIHITGIRRGEKLHEDLISLDESRRTVLRDKYYVICREAPRRGKSTAPFVLNSADHVLSKQELERELKLFNIIGSE